MADPMIDLPPLLLSTYILKIDAEGHMALPAKSRSQSRQGLTMAQGRERCVYLLPLNEFRRIASQIQHVSMGNKAARGYPHMFLSDAIDQQSDKQSRVLVLQILRDYTNPGSDVVAIGVGTRAELWNKNTWEPYPAEKEEGYSNITDNVLPGMES